MLGLALLFDFDNTLADKIALGIERPVLHITLNTGISELVSNGGMVLGTVTDEKRRGRGNNFDYDCSSIPAPEYDVPKSIPTAKPVIHEDSGNIECVKHLGRLGKLKSM